MEVQIGVGLTASRHIWPVLANDPAFKLSQNTRVTGLNLSAHLQSNGSHFQSEHLENWIHRHRRSTCLYCEFSKPLVSEKGSSNMAKARGNSYLQRGNKL